jgi:type I restriction enzyme S subunit
VEGIDLEDLPEGWRLGKVADLCEYSNERISINELSLNNYISTENMHQNRGGVFQANNLPTTGSATKFKIGNILISNIRPYFKKIWCASFNGGCSNDVLCFTPNKNIPQLYLYQILGKDNFFDYVMAGSKGTKMPRGDKKWIMNYETVIPSNKLLEKYTRTTEVFQRDIQITKSENQVLTELKELLLSKLATINNN